ncbi:MAG: two-component system response regulator AtoC [Hyphomicrobiaceae bacterium]|jgi:two-component system response regulator AtoC
MAYILIVEDERVLRRMLERNLAGRGHAVRAAASAEEATQILGQGAPDILITDQRLPGRSGLDLLHDVKGDHPATIVIVITAHGTVEDAVSAMKNGAADYLRKPVDLDELHVVVERCLERQHLTRELDYYRERDSVSGATVPIIGGSPAMDHLRRTVERVASLEKRDGAGPTVLLQGETGTGKGLVARAIHQASSHGDQPMIEVNCTAIPEHLLEAEIMGYEKGAFTDAAAAKPGLLEAAGRGTIFFDEIGHMSFGLQAKLLKVIEERVVRRLGSTRDRPTHCSLITATHMDLDRMVEERTFREDLYHRINVVRIEIPPLRERGEDILTLARHFAVRHALDYGVDVPDFTADALTTLRQHSWRGNIRELAHAVERAIVLGVNGPIDAASLALGTNRKAGEAATIGATPGRINVDFSNGPLSLDAVEEALLRAAIESSGGSKTEAARLLGISRDTFRYRFAKYEAETGKRDG